VHSLLARRSVKLVLQPLFGSAYRFNYNLFSTLHIGLVIIGGEYLLASDSVGFNFGSEWTYLAYATQFTGLIVILFGLKQYNLGLFSGLSQLRNSEIADDDENLHITGLHRYLRHPLYLGAYLYLIGGATSEFGLYTAFWGCLYLAIGTWFEERSLIVQFGAAYRDYQARVPSIIPYKGRAID
jgi:methanethiol S-methyltransferase